MTPELLGLLIFLLGVSLNAFFAGYETGFVASNPIRVRHKAERENDPAARRFLAYMESPDRMITLVLIGTNLALVMGTIAITRLAGPTLATLIATPMFLVFGEVVPKSMFRIHPTRLSLLLLPVIRFFDTVLAPAVVPVTWISRGFLRLVGEEQRDIRAIMTSLDDVRTLVDEGVHHGTIEPEEQEMIHSVMDLQSRQANEIMVPRIRIQALPETATRGELLSMFEETGRTRIPIYRGTIDEIIGVVNAFDVLMDPEPGTEDITRFIREILHVPDTLKLDDLLKAMRDARQPMAVVTDEYGGTDGIVAMEDVLEEIFGEIQDEYDKEERPIRKVGPHAYVIDARMSLDDAAAFMNIAIVDEEVDTVGGWVMHAVGRIPAKGEVIDFETYRVTVLNGGPNHLSSVRLEIRQQETPGAVSHGVQES
ncbi:MAG: HlyC/CorC family transporter [Nocardiopsis sp. BM-2018]|nr:MAG: HlyC/CorC family transporter [Nocardiopsis sp. BM-2018]